jgi:hypothetical protein
VERALFGLFFLIAAGMVVTGVLIDQVEETLFNATLV